MTENIDIKLYSKEYKDGVIRLQNQLNPTVSISEQRWDFEWFYEDNPYMKTLGLTPLFVAVHKDGMVVGVRGYCLLKYYVEDKEFYSLGASGAVVHPEYRRHGIFDALNTYSLKYLEQFREIKSFLNLSSNKFSTPGYLKLGWIPLAPKTYMHCFNPLYKYSKRNLQNSISFKHSVVKIEGLTQRLAKLYVNTFDTSEGFSLRRDSEYFSWRFKRPSSPSLFCSLFKKDQIEAYALIQNNGSYFKIIEYRYLDVSKLKLLVNSLKKLLPYRKISIWALSRPNEELRAFRAMGFIHFNRYYAKILRRPNQFAVVRPNVLHPVDADWRIAGRDMRQISNWDLYYSDVDSI